MELLLILTYTAICVAVFKIFSIPVNKWTTYSMRSQPDSSRPLVYFRIWGRTYREDGPSPSSTSRTTPPATTFEAAQVALYTPYAHHFAIIRRILLRMRSWENYVFLEGH